MKITGTHLGLNPNEGDHVRENLGPLKHSNWHGVMNSNKTPNEIDPEEFEACVRNIMTDDFVRSMILYKDENGFVIKNMTPEQRRAFESKIENVEYETVIEVGGAKNYVHAHVMVAITHRTNVQLDYEGWKQAMFDGGLRLTFGKWQLYKDNRANIFEYMRKSSYYPKQKKTPEGPAPTSYNPSAPEQPRLVKKPRERGFLPQINVKDLF